MAAGIAGPEIERLIQLLSKLPGFGPRSARRAALHLITDRSGLLGSLSQVMAQTAQIIRTCTSCGNIDSTDPCRICTDPGRDAALLCVVEQVSDLWAFERARAFTGRYHVLGGTLSALDGVRPEDLNIETLLARVRDGTVREVILALDATVDGQTTAHYVSEQLAGSGVALTRLAHGVPVGGELDYLDDGTLAAALKARRAMES